MIWPEPPERSPWEDEYGPLLSASEIPTELLREGATPLRTSERQRELIFLRDGAGTPRYPDFQFAGGAIMASLVQAFWIVAGAAMDPWRGMEWCVQASDDLDGRTPSMWAFLGGDSEPRRRGPCPRCVAGTVGS